MGSDSKESELRKWFQARGWSWEENNEGNLPSVSVQTGFGVNLQPRLFWGLMPEKRNQPGSLNPLKFHCQGCVCTEQTLSPAHALFRKTWKNEPTLMFLRPSLKQSQMINTAMKHFWPKCRKCHIAGEITPSPRTWQRGEKDTQRKRKWRTIIREIFGIMEWEETHRDPRMSWVAM